MMRCYYLCVCVCVAGCVCTCSVTLAAARDASAPVNANGERRGEKRFFAEDIAFAPNGDVAMTANAGPGVGGFDIMHPDRTWTNANTATYSLGLPWPYPTDNTSAVGYRQNGNLLFAPTNNGLKEYDGDGYIEKIPNGWSIEHIGVAGIGRAWSA